MKKLRHITVLAAGLLLTGCVVHDHSPPPRHVVVHEAPPRTVIVHEAPSRTVVVKKNPAHTVVVTPHGTYDYHCPPGQHKKGRC